MHFRYNPQKDGGPQHKECPGCESLYVIHLYCGIARKRALAGEGMVVSHPEACPEENQSEIDRGDSMNPTLEETES